ncbi:LOW QUALITY PROTEIN: putative late blight resistance protein homolog R1A-3 [Primulina tabacum]|uniref:LOW QUALITY PROTEIN: putative late blight resistance protein homolog R1A-3 n=1 Tax=Primulina tabacum TaxID=48773 RepID=UPI003F59F2C6
MAYAAITSLEQTLQRIFLHPDRYSIPCDNKHIESFNEKLEFLQRFLEEHPSHKNNEKVTSLETRIRDVAYEAEDFMDLHLNNLSDSEKMMGQINMELMMKKVDSIVEEVTEIKEQMGLEITQRRGFSMEEEIKIGKVSNHEDLEPRNALDSSLLVSSYRKNLMVGFDDHLMKIKDQLKGQSSALEVVSIVGMGGIGKTTLATHVYSDLHMESHFDICAWATVSQAYSVRDILLGMLHSMKKLTKEMLRESDAQLGLHVYQNLNGRRYLVTIDDIWDTNAWDALKMMFPDDNTGSRIMLTTRIGSVAAYASPCGTLHEITLLGNEESWTLLCAKVFRDESCPLNLQQIGKQLAHNCGGLPLSIAVIGGLLSKVEKTQTAWQSIAENVTSFVFSSDGGQCSDILRLSYNFLPRYLKACFLYMGVFPKSYEINASKLTQMWVAEGFLRQAHGQSSEEVAERCVEDLLDRSLILMSKKNSEGKIKAFRIHDFLHDFSVEEAKYEKFLEIKKIGAYLLPISIASERRISIHSVEVLEHSQFPSISSTSSHVRSLVCVGQCSLSSSVFSRFKLLRVLDVIQLEFREFPSQLLELLNLRYIALICNGDIPASITKLWNLQTLIIVRNWSRSSKNYLPVEIWTMAHLRHVRCDEAHLLDPSAAKYDICRKTFVFEELQTLSGLWNLVFTEELLQKIPNIKKIDVEYESRYLNKWSDYQLENLGNLHQLKTLKICVFPCLGVLVNLFKPSRFKFHFPTSLKTLILGGVGIPWHDLAIIGSLPNLEVLKLINCACLGTVWEPNEGEFCELKVLVLERLKLNHWEADHNHFPCLQRLVIRWCYGLIEIPSGMGDSPTLNTIELCGCKDSVFASANEIVEKQRSYGNDDFQVIVDDKKRPDSINHVIAEFLGLPSIFG